MHRKHISCEHQRIMVDKYSSQFEDEKHSLRSFPLIKHSMIRWNITLRHKDVRQGKYFDHYKRCISYTLKIDKFSSFEAISLKIFLLSLRPLLDYIFFFDYEICIQVLQRLEINACVHS